VRDTGARIRLISDGDLSAGISAAVAGTNIHALDGIGGAPRRRYHCSCNEVFECEIQARLVFDADKLGVDKAKVPSEMKYSAIGINGYTRS
jgi:fructose-1,6-bisphosphatase/sedoheptulose 1,7-bisphosphatase-like protein